MGLTAQLHAFDIACQPFYNGLASSCLPTLVTMAESY